MPDDDAVLIDDDRLVKAEALDRRRNLLDSKFADLSRVLVVGLRLACFPMFNAHLLFYRPSKVFEASTQ